MRKMVLCDLASLRGESLNGVAFVLIAAAFAAFGMGSPLVLPIFFGVLGGQRALLTLLGRDENGGWAPFRLTFPLSRREVVFGRYATVALMSVAYAVAGTLITVAVILVVGSVPGGERFGLTIAVDADFLPGMVAVCLESLALQLLGAAAVIPLVTRFGLSRGVSYLSLLAMAISCGTISAISMTPEIASAVTANSLLAATLVITAAVVVAYVASALLSARIYQAREL